jgi:hypothetical protein
MAYRFPQDCISLQSTLGVYGVLTSRLETAHDVIDVTNILFGTDFDFGMTEEDDHAILLQQQAALKDLSREARKIMVARNVGKLPPKLFAWKPDHQSRIQKTRNKLHLHGKWR